MIGYGTPDSDAPDFSRHDIPFVSWCLDSIHLKRDDDIRDENASHLAPTSIKTAHWERMFLYQSDFLRSPVFQWSL
jgi:hypothetical protein